MTSDSNTANIGVNPMIGIITIDTFLFNFS